MPTVLKLMSGWSRRHKFQLFMKKIQPNENTRVLDVGVANAGFGLGQNTSALNFFEGFYPWPEKITAVALHDFSEFKQAFPNIRCVTASGCELPFHDGAFDVAFSNAVIEHVGDRTAQQEFANEICRVAKKVFVTTPNRWSPLETHIMWPLVHWLPSRYFNAFIKHILKQNRPRIELLGPKDLGTLFPGKKIIRGWITLIITEP